MSRYIIDTDKHMSQFDGIIMTTVSGLEDAEKALEDAYQRGFEDGKAVREKGCEGCEYAHKYEEHSPCDGCCNAYSNKWTAKPVPFEFGDEIVDKHGIKGCVVSRDNEGKNTMYALFNCNDVPQCITQKNYRKTGRHFDIASILEAMKA